VELIGTRIGVLDPGLVELLNEALRLHLSRCAGVDVHGNAPE
jgi:hypothetical protein